MINDDLAGLRIAFVTPTYNRPDLLARTLEYASYQRLHGATGRWIVLDDSPAPHPILSCSADDAVDYTWRPVKAPLGAKRNFLNERAAEWGADIICAMDDDDWYGADYGADMARLLVGYSYDFAGSGDDYYYHAGTGRILKAAAVRPMSSCNGVLSYKAAVLDACRYNDGAVSGEEPSFLGRRPVIQHPDISRIHLALAHPGNTVSKRNYVINPACHTDLTLDDFPMREADRAFYRALSEAGRLS